MHALQQQSKTPVKFYGVGGEAMAAAGLNTLFAIEELAVIGPAAFIAAIPRGYRLAKKLVDYLSKQDLDALIVIDSPEFNHPVARWLRSGNRTLPIFDLVAPTVWAWRPWRARKMKSYISEVLAILPFEPQVFAELDGPPCTFVGHPAMDRAKHFSMTGRAFRKKYLIPEDKSLLVMLPGSRRSEIKRHMAIFNQAINQFEDSVGEVCIVMPIIPHMMREVSSQLQKLQLNVLQIENEAEKWGAFRAADLALSASGTVTLELAATHTPMVVAYRLDTIASLFKWLVNVHSVVLPNLIMDENIVPEFIDGSCTPGALSAALIELFQSEKTRHRQSDFLKRAVKKAGSTEQLKTADHAARTILRRLGSA
jgi:lipid-A-disaccharide synthase